MKKQKLINTIEGLKLRDWRIVMGSFDPSACVLGFYSDNNQYFVYANEKDHVRSELFHVPDEMEALKTLAVMAAGKTSYVNPTRSAAARIAHETGTTRWYNSMPVITEQNNEYYLSIFSCRRSAMKKDEISYPAMWTVADIITGKVLYAREDNAAMENIACVEAVDAEERIYSLMDSIREYYSDTGLIDEGRYAKYMSSIMKLCPEALKECYQKISIKTKPEEWGISRFIMREKASLAKNARLGLSTVKNLATEAKNKLSG